MVGNAAFIDLGPHNFRLDGSVLLNSTPISRS